MNLLRFHANLFSWVTGTLAQVFTQVQHGFHPTPETLGHLGSALGDLERECESLEVPSILAQVKRIKETLDRSPLADQELARLLMELHTRIMDELEGRLFLYVPISRKRQYEEPRQAWTAALNRFPLAGDDIEEAEKCFALGRYPACVFHLMRVTETAVLEFGKVIDPTDPKPQFGSVLKKVEQLLQTTPFPKWPKDAQPYQALFRDSLPQLYAVKRAWRDKVSHFETRILPSESVYTEEVASDILNATRSLMRLLAERLPSDGP
jgi:hypothetical protein